MASQNHDLDVSCDGLFIIFIICTAIGLSVVKIWSKFLFLRRSRILEHFLTQHVRLKFFLYVSLCSSYTILFQYVQCNNIW